MTVDTSWIPAVLDQTVPWIRSAGLRFEEVTPERAVVHLPDREEQRNHIGGPHAAMIFGLGETASGAVGLAAFGAAMERATPLVVRSEIEYLRVSKGPLTAVAQLQRPAAEVLAELEAGRRPEFVVTVAITDGSGRETARLNVVWTLRPNRS